MADTLKQESIFWASAQGRDTVSLELQRGTGEIMDEAALTIERLAASHERLADALFDLRQAVMDILCNGGTPTHKGAPERLHDALMNADDALERSRKEPQNPAEGG